jgi:hypothetical protein
MKVKVGDTVYSDDDQPLMIILSNADKTNIVNMNPESTKYCSFPDSISEEQARAFMKV